MSGPEVDRQIPRGGILLHIGPPKTGTSALQGACHAQRDALKRAGVHYAGSGVQPSTAAYAVTLREHPNTGRPPPMCHWKSLVREVNAKRAETVLISSEFFAGASDAQAREIVRALGAERVYLVITLRPLGKIFASRWQQNVQEGARVSYEDWLGDVLRAPDSAHAKRFWSRQRHDALIRRWAAAAGPSHVHVIVIDDQDHDGILRSFEQLLGIPTKTLTGHRDSPNRSMTLEEIEVIRAFNSQFADEGISQALRYKLMSRGAATHMKRRTPDRSEPRIATPEWAVAEANRITSEMIGSITALGVGIHGDLASLLTSPATVGGVADHSGAKEVLVRPEIAARAAMGVLFASGATRGYEAGGGVPAWGEAYELQRVRTTQLLALVGQRLFMTIARRLRSLFRR